MLTIRFAEVGMTFGRRQLFRDLSASCTAGCLTVVAGANGCGKSTFLRLAAQLMRPTAGQVTAYDGDILLSREILRRQTAMVTPEMHLYPRLTAEENLAFFLGLCGCRLTRLDMGELWGRIGLTADVGAVPAEQLSTGMRQRVKLAILLASGARLWLLDEPGMNLDEAGCGIVLREARQAADSGKLVILATNDHREEAAADAVIHLGGH